MPKTDLQIAGDDYVPVADRIRQFYERFATGRIVTQLVRRTDEEVIVRAEVFRTATERHPAATGLAAEREGDGDINTVACLENTETSAIGRALANLGFAASKPAASESTTTSQPHTARPHARAEQRVAEPSASRQAERERPVRPIDVEAQRRADHATEILGLLGRAERLGFSPGKARVIRARAIHPHVEVSTHVRLDRRLRDWLERRLDRVDGW
jgi:pyruvate/2-oxoglutarate dehydrogenase complex dihydrolipoamide acyltransferase (E2) component